MKSFTRQSALHRISPSGCTFTLALLGLVVAGCSNRDTTALPQQQRDKAVPETKPTSQDVPSPSSRFDTPPPILNESCAHCVAVGLALRRPDGLVTTTGRIDSSSRFDHLFQSGLAWKRIQRGTYLTGDSIRWIAKGRDTIEIQRKQDPSEKCVRKYRIRHGWLVVNSRSEVVALQDAPSIAARIDSLMRLGHSFGYTVQGFDATMDPDECEYIPNAVDEILRNALRNQRNR